MLWPTAALAAERGAVVVLDEQGEELLSYGGSYALLVGVSDYERGWPKLPGVKDDVAAVRYALEQHGFDVTVVSDPDGQDLQKSYQDFILNYGRNEHNRLLFYFAGHGYTDKPPWALEDKDEWMGYIVARDAPLPSEDLKGFLRKGLSMQRFEELAKQIHAHHALFIFDSCFSGSIFAIKRSPPADVERRSAKPVRQFIASGTADQSVPDVSVFRKEFIAALGGAADRGGDGYVTGTELGYYLQERVSNYTANAQTPQYGKIRDRHLDKGDFVFRVGGSSSAEAPLESASRPPAPVKFVGNLQVNVSVPATVYVDDRRLGEAGPNMPFNEEGMPIGEARVRVEAKGYQTATRTVEIRSGQWTQLVFELEREELLSAGLTVRSNVSGDVLYVNEKSYGPTGPGVLELAPGKYRLRVEKEGYEDWEHDVVLKPGEQRVLRAWLRRPPEREAEPAILTLRSNVYGDRVFVDDRLRGSTRLDLELEPGPHRVVIEKEGYLPFEKHIELSPGQRLALHAELRRPGVVPGMVRDLFHAWVQNAVHRDMGGLWELASLPFLLYDRVAQSEAQFLEMWHDHVRRPNYAQSAEIIGIEALEIPPADAGRVLPQLTEFAPELGDDTSLFRLIVVSDRARELRLVMITRRTDQGLKIAGVCCAEIEH